MTRYWLWAALLLLIAYVAMHELAHYRVRQALEPCVSGERTTCEVDGATVHVEP